MGRAWGNALGGWRKQKRAKNGRFGNGSGPSKRRTRTPKKRSSTARNLALAGVGAVAVYSATKAVQNKRDQPKILSSYHSKGIQYTTQRKTLKNDFGRKYKTVTTFAHKNSKLVGYTESYIHGDTVTVDQTYVKQSLRGTGVAGEMFRAGQAQVKGKKIKASSMRSDFSDPIAKAKLGAKVSKRSNEATHKEIVEQMEEAFSLQSRDFLSVYQSHVRARAKRRRR